MAVVSADECTSGNDGGRSNRGESLIAPEPGPTPLSRPPHVRSDASAPPEEARHKTASLRETLSRATRGDHVALDASLSNLDLADARDYRRFLQIHLAALTVLVDRCGVPDRDDVQTWMTCLRLDLSIDAPRESAPVVAADPLDRLDQAGTAYVLRGSRLGAAFLVKRVGDGLPTRYLSRRPTLSWPHFLGRLASLDELAAAEGTDRAVAAARSAFGVFAMAARDHVATS